MVTPGTSSTEVDSLYLMDQNAAPSSVLTKLLTVTYCFLEMSDSQKTRSNHILVRLSRYVLRYRPIDQTFCVSISQAKLSDQ
jgi:hypothetical protein